MADFDVFPVQLQSSTADFARMKAILDGTSTSISEVKNNLKFMNASAKIIRAKLAVVAADVKKEAASSAKMGDALAEIADQYVRHEKSILGACGDGEISYAEDNNQDPDSSKIVWAKGGSIKKDINKPKKRTKIKGYYDKDGWHDETPKKDKKGYDIEEDEKTSDKKKSIKDSISDVHVVDAKNEVEGFVWGLKDDDGPVTYDVKTLDGEAHANAFAGLVGFDEDGNKVLRPGAGFDIGGSITALTASGKAMLGDEMFGAYLGGDVTVGKAEGKLEGKIGMVDGHINAEVELSAEATFVEANVNIGANVVGTDIKGEIGFNVGVGAHANVGIEGGKIKLDIGASIGLGVSAKLEIDFSGTIDKAKESIKNVGATMGKAVSKLRKWFKF